MPKTGGRTIERHITERFGIPNVFHAKKDKSWFTDFFMSAKMVPASAEAEAHIIGHYAPLSLIRGREENYYKVCFWRHPADWFLSFYNYRHFRHAGRLKRKFTFADFEKSMLRNPMTEYLLLYCGAIPGWTYFFMSDRAKFDAACALIEKFDYFADIANVDDFLETVGNGEGGKPSIHNRIQPCHKTLPGLDEVARRAIVRSNAIDFYLHRLTLRRDRAAVCEEARKRLKSSFNFLDLLRLAAVPYYRFRIWVLPFIPTLKSLTSQRHKSVVRFPGFPTTSHYRPSKPKAEGPLPLRLRSKEPVGRADVSG